MNKELKLGQKFPTLDQVWLFAGIALLTLRVFLTPIPPNDFWWHGAMGRLILQTSTVPLSDSFSYTQTGHSFYNQSWLAQIFLYLIYQIGGLPLLILMQAGIISLTYLILLQLTIKRSENIRLSVVFLLFTALISFDNLNVRPQTYAFPLFVAFLSILTSWRIFPTKTSPLWLLPLLMLLWVNIHGSFVLGGVLIALTFLGELLRQTLATKPTEKQNPSLKTLFFWGSLTACAILLNPRGIGVLSYVFNLLQTSAVTDLVTEWAPPTIRDLWGKIFFLHLIASLALFIYAPRKPHWFDLFLLLPFLWLALGAGRNIVWFGFLITPILAVQGASVLTLLKGNRAKVIEIPLINNILIGIIALLLGLASPWLKPHLGLPPANGNLLTTDTPVAAVNWLQKQTKHPKRLFHSLAYGSYLIWALPKPQVFIDPRIELYPYAQWRDYIDLSGGNNAEEILTKYQFDGFLLDKVDQAGLVDFLRTKPAWKIRYEDARAIYFAVED